MPASPLQENHITNLHSIATATGKPALPDILLTNSFLAYNSQYSVCRETRLRIKRQPGFFRVQNRKGGKARDEKGHSISMLPAFSSSWQQT